MPTLRNLQNSWLWFFLLALTVLQIFRDYHLAGIDTFAAFQQSVFSAPDMFFDFIKEVLVVSRAS